MDTSWGVIIALIVLYVLVLALIALVVVFYIHGDTVGPTGPIGPTGPAGGVTPSPLPILPINGIVNNQLVLSNTMTIIEWNEGSTFTLPVGEYAVASTLTYEAGQGGTRSIAVWVRDKGETNMNNLLGMNTVTAVTGQTTLITLPLGMRFSLTGTKEVSIVTWHTNPTSLTINGTMSIRRETGESGGSPSVSLLQFNPHFQC